MASSFYTIGYKNSISICSKQLVWMIVAKLCGHPVHAGHLAAVNRINRRGGRVRCLGWMS